MRKLYKTSALALCMMIASSAAASASAAQIGAGDITELCNGSTCIQDILAGCADGSCDTASDCNGSTCIQDILAGCADGSCDLQSLINNGCCTPEDITNLINCTGGSCGILIDDKQCITSDGECPQCDADAQNNTPSEPTGNTQNTVPSEPKDNTQNTVPSEPTGNTQNTSPSAADISAYEKEVAELVNSYRAQYGLPPLTLSKELSDVARAKSQDMHDKKYFSHTSPTYGSPFDMMKAFGITYRTAGENIAMGQQTPKAVVEAWMNSEGHRANILNSGFTHIGVGYVQDGNYWTQMFIG